MRVPLRPVVCVAFVFLAALACARDARAVEFGPSPTASARSKMLECDSAVVMLLVETSNQVDTMPDGSIRGTGTSEVLALGSNGPEWMRRFADALLPEGREWKARMAPGGGSRARGRPRPVDGARARLLEGRAAFVLGREPARWLGGRGTGRAARRVRSARLARLPSRRARHRHAGVSRRGEAPAQSPRAGRHDHASARTHAALTRRRCCGAAAGTVAPGVAPR